MKEKTEITTVWEEYERGKNYNYQQQLYEKSKKNYDFYHGNQWGNTKLEGMQPITLNIIKSIVKYKVGVVKTNSYQIYFNSDTYENEEQLVSVLSHFKKEHGGWDYIIHNAGLTKTTDKNAFFKVNAENTRRFIAALSVAGCAPKKFLLMSSLSSFGKGDEKGFTPICLTDKQMPHQHNE